MQRHLQTLRTTTTTLHQYLPDNNTITATINVGQSPNGEIAVNPAGTMVYVVNGNNVSVINTKINTVTATMPVGDAPSGIAIAPDGTKVYVANSGTFDIPGNTVSVIDTSTNTAEATNSDLIGSKTKASVNKHKLKNHSKHHKAEKATQNTTKLKKML